MSYNFVAINSFKSQADADKYQENKSVSEKAKELDDKHAKAIEKSLDKCKKYGDRALTEIVEALIGMELDHNAQHKTTSSIKSTVEKIIQSHIENEEFKRRISISICSSATARYYKLTDILIELKRENNGSCRVVDIGILSHGNIIDEFSGVEYGGVTLGYPKEKPDSLISFITQKIQSIITKENKDKNLKIQAGCTIIALAKEFNKNGDANKKDFINFLSFMGSIKSDISTSYHYYKVDEITQSVATEVDNIFSAKKEQNEKEGE